MSLVEDDWTNRQNKTVVPKELTTGHRSSVYMVSVQAHPRSLCTEGGTVVTLLHSVHHDAQVEGEDRTPHVILQ